MTCVVKMHTSFGITLVLYLLKLSAGKGFKNDYNYVPEKYKQK